MARDSDIYDPLNTKTIGGEFRLDVDTYENVQDPIHLESVNRKLLELTDLIGRVTNNRSSSGPIPGTGKIIKITDTTGSGSPSGDVFTPEHGEVWVIVGAQIGAMAANKCSLLVRDADNNQTVQIAAETSAFAQFDPVATGAHVFITKNLHLEYEFTSATGDCIVKVALQRVR